MPSKVDQVCLCGLGVDCHCDLITHCYKCLATVWLMTKNNKPGAVCTNCGNAFRNPDTIDPDSNNHTEHQLADAFDLVKDSDDWRNPIRKHVPDTADINCIQKAVIHFTGTVATVSRRGDYFLIEATGYRNGPCGP